MRNRNIALCIILSLVTCGIYNLYWWACLADEGNRGAGTPGTSGVVVILLSIITCGIYGLYWSYTMGDKINRAKEQHGFPTDSNAGLVYLLLSLFGLSLVAEALMQNEFNKMTVPN